MQESKLIAQMIDKRKRGEFSSKREKEIKSSAQTLIELEMLANERVSREGSKMGQQGEGL